MFKTIRVTLVVCLLSIFMGYSYYGQSGFCEGWENGWKAGYCYGDTYCMAPLAPLCPLPRLGEDSYQGGYNRGFIAGINEAERR
ncbi:MAG: hypothetical protein ABSH16_00010 [Sedimentisphaerales bacterium]